MSKVHIKDLKIFSTLKNYSSRKYIDFHMPGHKGGRKLPGAFKRNLYKIDTTELLYSDNLYAPKGMLLHLMEEISRYYNSKKSYLLLNGATQGIHAAIHAVLNKEDKIIAARDCHVSFLNALSLTGSIPVFTNEVDKIRPDIFDEIALLIEKNKDAKAVFFTYPNYYGNCVEAKKIIELAHDNKMLVIVDEAHGAHLRYSSSLPESCVDLGADIVIQSVHKTLPALTQTGLMHINNGLLIKAIDSSIKIFSTTSPSYILIAAVEFSFRFMIKSGKMEIERIIRSTERITGHGKIARVWNDDFTRLVFDVSKTGYTGFEISRILFERFKIVIEMADLEYIVLITSVMSKRRDIVKLEHALKALETLERNIEIENIQIDSTKIGKEASSNVYIYPPGTPLIVQGDVIAKDKLEYIERVKKAGGEIIEC